MPITESEFKRIAFTIDESLRDYFEMSLRALARDQVRDFLLTEVRDVVADEVRKLACQGLEVMVTYKPKHEEASS